MSDRTKRIWKRVLVQIGIILLTAAISAIIWYAFHGWPIAGNLRQQAEQGNIREVRITRQGESVTLTDPERLRLAAGTAQLLCVSLPGTASEGETPEMEYLFTFSDGKTMRIGVSDETILKDGRQYAPGGDKNSPTLFVNVTEGLFFLK